MVQRNAMAARSADLVETLSASTETIEADELRDQVRAKLEAAGFVFAKGRPRLPDAGTDDPKEVARRLHRAHREAVLAKNGTFLVQWEERALERFADGSEVNPERIEPYVVRVTTD